MLHLGRIPPYSLRRVGQDYEVRLRGRHQLDPAALRRLREVSGAEFRQDSEETVLLLRVTCDCVAESGVTDGMLFVDLRPATAAAPAKAAAPATPPQNPASPREAQAAREAAQIAAARQRLLDDAVRLGLMSPDQAKAMLQGSAATAPAAAAPPAPPAPPPADDLGALRESMLSRRPC
ncbi:hypothetical protein [Teichococcus aestuarii]|uniref:hypothetical protein n=1 Tax=Teichococcus aestuarii TaxID=568898 RepID=UPI003614D475